MNQFTDEHQVSFLEILEVKRKKSLIINNPRWEDLRDAIRAIDGINRYFVSLHTANINFQMSGGTVSDRIWVTFSVVNDIGRTVHAGQIYDSVISSDDNADFVIPPGDEDHVRHLRETMPKKVIYSLVKVILEENRLPLEYLPAQYGWIIHNPNVMG